MSYSCEVSQSKVANDQNLGGSRNAGGFCGGPDDIRDIRVTGSDG